MRDLLLCILVALSLAAHGIKGNNLYRLSRSDFSIDDYKSFIKHVRYEVAFATYRISGIPVLKHSVPNSKRFHFIDLTNESDETITMAVDVEDLGVAAYRTGNESHFFQNAPQVAFEIVFSNTHQNILNFDNTFESLENAAGTTRMATPLGNEPLHSAISNLFHYRRELVPVSFLVIIQMVIEASKFKFIEQSVANSLRDETNFTPGLAVVSLEDNWSELSLQFQASRSLQGIFGKHIRLYNSNNEPMDLDSTYYPIIVANVALLLYRCPVTGSDFIRMPSVGDDEVLNNDACYLQQHTTRISGREGFCVDVAGALDADGSRVISYTCGQQVNQKWTFHNDWTIRSLGKCLISNTSTFGNSLVIYDCDKAIPEETYWDVSIGGTFMNPFSDLVLTANAATESTNLTMEDNTYASSQSWRPGDYVEPIIASIIGLKEMCLEATDGNTNLWLENCVKNKEEQKWAIYADETIRVNNNRSLCVTSSTDSSSKLITIRSCNGSVNQHWLFMAEGTILNLEHEFLMDVAQNNVYLKKIILHPANRSPNQQWVLFY